MAIYYSATTNSFYDSNIIEITQMPEDSKIVTDANYKALMDAQCDGHVITANSDGTPCAITQQCDPCSGLIHDLTIATANKLGHVKAGGNVSIDANGVMNANINLSGYALDSNVVHKSGNETINGVKSFGGIIKATNGTVQVGADKGYSVTFNHNGNITSKQARGTYNIFFPEGSGTLALTSDINGKANDSDVVHKTGDETINGTKTFTQTVNIKNNNFDLNVTPTNNIFSTIAFRDKNNTTTASLQNSQRTYGVNDVCFYVNDNSSKPHGFRIRTDKILEPIENNTYSLGSPSNKWLKVHSDDVVHTSGNETIAGSKTFSNQMYLGGGGTSYGLISAKDNNSILRLFGGTSAGTGANLDLYGENVSSGGFSLRARTSDKIVGLDGKTDGTLKWNGKDVAIDENLVHRSGNETIGGVKSFNNLMYIYNNMSNKNNQMDLFKTPANTLFSHYMFVDKNNEVSAYMRYGQQNTGTDFIGLFIHDKSRALHGIQVTTNNEVIPIANNTYSLGSSSAKWANVYASEINTKYFTYTHDNRTYYSYLPKTSGTLAIQERTRASSVVENRTLLYECAGGLDLGDIMLNDVYSKFNALLIVYSNDDGGGISTYYLDCAELDIRREVAGSGSGSSSTFLLVDGHSWWACTGASTGTKFVHSKNNGLRIHKIYGLAKYY